MTGIARWMSLPGADRRLLAQAMRANIEARLLLHLWSMDRLRSWAGRRGDGRIDAGRVIWAARAAARRVPFATCLSSALALQRLMARNGHECDLHIGVARDAGAFVAHAWVEHGGRVVLGEDEQRTYARLLAWSVPGGGERTPGGH